MDVSMPPAAAKVRFRSQGGRDATIGLAPLIDVVLLLICFYLFVAKSMADLDDPAVELPVLRQQAAADPEPGELVVNLRADGTIALAGEAASEAHLERRLLAARQASASPAVVIRADRRLAFGELARVQRLCEQVGYQQIVLRTVGEEP